jgi:hypothetical protein
MYLDGSSYDFSSEWLQNWYRDNKMNSLGAWNMQHASYTSTPPLRLHGMVLSEGTGTTLPFTFFPLSFTNFNHVSWGETSRQVCSYMQVCHNWTEFETFTMVKIQVQVFSVVMPCSDVTAYQHIRGGWMDLWIAGILPQHYTASQPGRPRLEFSPQWKTQISHPCASRFRTGC